MVEQQTACSLGAIGCELEVAVCCTATATDYPESDRRWRGYVQVVQIAVGDRS